MNLQINTSRIRCFLVTVASYGVLILGWDTALGGTLPVLRIDTKKVIARVGPLHAGLMTEEINHAFDGGLYGELVANSALNAEVQPKAGRFGPWSLVGKREEADGLALDAGHPLNGATPVALRIEAASAAKGRSVGVANSGFWGIPLRPNTRYRLSFYAKAANDFKGPLSASLERADGSSISTSAAVTVAPGPWKRYGAVLITPSDIEPIASGRLTIATEQAGTFWVTRVSLFPPTWADRPNGNRIDLMQKLAALRPKFLRFPGGGYLNGASVETRFDWKNTLGPVTERPGHPSPWGYWSSDGMGYLEFLLWCEDLGMEPVVGVWAGSAVVQAGEVLQPFVQEALDEIEYATGNTTSPWGARRARDGHPAPFKLRYVEIGNEEITPDYDARFAQFYDAIKAKYPTIQIIAAGQIKDTGSRPGDMDYRKSAQVSSRVPYVLDEHFYQTAKDAFAEVSRFDRYDRKGPKIFVGEWATMEGVPVTPNMLAALGDGAWMIGMERNADVVIMQAYAPLFANINAGASQWQTNLIGYDSLHSYGSPSYYAQVLFNTYRGDEVLSTPVSIAPNFFTSATRDSDSGRIYIKAVNASGTVQPVRVELPGSSKLEPEGKEIVLSGPPESTNSILEPRKIVPVERSLQDVKAVFEHSFVAHSVTVLELSASPVGN